MLRTENKIHRETGWQDLPAGLFLFRGKDNIHAFLHRGVQSLNEKVCKVIILRQAFKKSTVQIFARQQKIDDNIIF